MDKQSVKETQHHTEFRVSHGDMLLLIVVTGGIALAFFVAFFIYSSARAFIRRFIKKIPDWNDF